MSQDFKGTINGLWGSTHPLFHAVIASQQNDVTGDGTLYQLTGAIWTEITDKGTNFADGTFTAPATGLYLFTGIVALDAIASAHTYSYMTLYTPNRTYYFQNGGCYSMSNSGALHVPFSLIADMDISETAYLSIRIYNGTKVVDLTTSTYFSGLRIF